LIGSVIDKYEVLEKVGEGGMATVYLGKHVTLGRVVAIKVLHPHLSASTRNRLRFEREARAIEHLDHENILEIYDYSGRDVDDCYIVTEFVKGRTLHQLLSERGLVPSEVAAMIGLRLASALAYAHHAGIIHRDLKPENVMLADDGTVKLMDFGIARFLDETTVTMTGALVGSPAYMSPEQALERTVDARSDLFSLGSLLFHLVTGRMPFSGSNPSIILRNIIESRRSEVLELQPAASARLADVLERLLQTSPEARFEDAIGVCNALEDVLGESGLSEARPQWSLIAYLEDPDDYETRLAEHLDVRLLAEGREAFEEGDHLGAQRMFNRLLARHPEHPEVLEILANAQYPDVLERSEDKRGGSWLRWALVAMAGIGATGAWFLLRPEPPAVVEETPIEEPVVVEDPVLDLEVSEVVLDEPPVEDPPVERAKVKTPGTPVVRSVEEPVVAEVEVIEEPPPVVPARLEFRMARASWGELYLNGKEYGKIQRTTAFELQPGEYNVLVKNPYAYDFETNLTLAEGETAPLRVEMRKRPVDVRISGYEPECELFLDGGLMGTVEELGSFQVYTYQGNFQVACKGETQDFPFNKNGGDLLELSPGAG